MKEFSHYNTTKKWIKLIDFLLRKKNNKTNKYYISQK